MEVGCLWYPGASTFGSQLPTAGKSWQPGQEPPRGREESRHPSHWEHQWKRGGKKPLINWVTTLIFVIRPCWIKHAKSCQTHQNGWTLNALDHAKMHTGSRSWYMRISHTPLTSRLKQVLLVVNSVKLHLTAFTCTKQLMLYFVLDTCCNTPLE